MPYNPNSGVTEVYYDYRTQRSHYVYGNGSSMIYDGKTGMSYYNQSPPPDVNPFRDTSSLFKKKEKERKTMARTPKTQNADYQLMNLSTGSLLFANVPDGVGYTIRKLTTYGELDWQALASTKVQDESQNSYVTHVTNGMVLQMSIGYDWQAMLRINDGKVEVLAVSDSYTLTEVSSFTA